MKDSSETDSLGKTNAQLIDEYATNPRKFQYVEASMHRAQLPPHQVAWRGRSDMVDNRTSDVNLFGANSYWLSPQAIEPWGSAPMKPVVDTHWLVASICPKHFRVPDDCARRPGTAR
jgi:hypothetical protein